MRELAAQMRKKGLRGDPGGKRGRAEPAQARGRRQEGSRAVSGHQDRRHLQPRGNRQRTRPTEVIRAQKANPQIQGWAMIGGWALFTPRLMKELDPQKVKVVAVNALPAQLAFVESGLAPVLLALPTYNWGYVSVQRIVDKVHLKQDVPTIIPPMEAVRVTKDNLGTWARQLKTWGASVPDRYLKLE